MGDGGPNNLNLVEPDQPLDQRNDGSGPDRRGPLRPPHKVRFRPPQGLEGQEPEFFEGPAGDRNEFRGTGTDNPGDVGSPSSGIFASWKRRRAAALMPEPTMPNAKKESDPLEEGQTESGAPGADNQAFYDMQAR